MSRTCVLLPLLIALSAALFASSAFAQGTPKKLRVYVGTYTDKESKGIYVTELDLATGKLAEPKLAAEAVSPSFLAIHPNGKLLVAVNEISDLNGKKVGGVTSFAIDQASGELKKLSQQPSGGGGPCHVVIDRSGKFALAANYGGGSCCVHPLAADGTLGEMSGFAQHTGSSVDASRQKEPHAHAINVSADNRFAFCADLGLDKILVYKLDAQGAITPHDPPHAATKPGGGPRHFAFHPSGKFAYSNLEMTSEVTAFAYDAEKGVLTSLQTLSTLPAPHSGNSTAEVQVHPSGKFLYVSNRGHNSIAIFTIGAEGQLTAAGHQGEGINIPRNFSVDPTGQFVLVANQAGNSVIVFRIDQATGKLTPTESKIAVGAPVCVKMLPLP